MKKSGPDPDQKFLRLFKKANVLPPEFEIHQLLLEFSYRSHISIFNRLVLGIFMPKYPIQEVPFDYGIKVTNIGNTLFKGGWIEKLKISQESPALTYLSPIDRFDVPDLNSSESKMIWCGRLKLHFQGAISVSCIIRPNDEYHAIETYQRVPCAGSIEASEDQPSNWYFTSYIEPRAELLSRNTNMLLLLLALLTFFNLRATNIIAAVKALFK